METNKTGRYIIQGEIGRGGMATVFHAHDPRFDRDVALKVLPQALMHDPQFRVRFEREAKTIGLLEHPAIVPVYDFGEEDGQPYIVMRMMTGGSLTEKLENGPLSPEEAGKIIMRVGQALDVAHSKGIIHRDLKPGNILFDQYGNAFLSDFGIARLTDSGSTLTGSQIIGTPAYMSPEQIQGNKEIDGRSDLYALGIILFHILTKEMPFKADTPAKLMMAHVLDSVPDITSVRPSLPEGVNRVIAKAMEKDPDDRYPTGVALAEDYIATIEGRAPADEATRVSEGLDLENAPTIQTSPISPEEAATVVARGQEAGGMAATGTMAAPPTEAFQRSTTSRVLGIGLVLVLVVFAVVGGLFIFNALGSIGATPVALTTPTDRPAPTIEPTTPLEPTATDVLAVIATEEPTPEPTATEPAVEPTEAPPTLLPAAPIIGGADLIAYIDGNNIHTANLDGTEINQLTDDGQAKFNLVWVPGGETIAYISGGCIKEVSLEGVQNDIACFEIAEFFEGFDISPDGSRIAISLNRELFIAEFDREALKAARFRTHLIALSSCEHFAPYDRGSNVPAKSVQFSSDGTRVALLIVSAGATGLQEDLVTIIDLENCVEKPNIVDNFPGTRFVIDNYNITPLLKSWDWDGGFLFLMNNFVRNANYGDMYSYSMVNKRGGKINPIGERCCYLSPTWSPDGRYVFFAFQDFAQGANSTTVFYYVQFATLNSGGQLVPMDIPPLVNAQQYTEAALRPAQRP